ncbi:trypsin-like peptidase domain-containing protein [Streptomyces sp. NPDC048603]|uniref:VMAP-C domain-containing protein n=1 Tax=Streptomyces sp. NPDC048603 TaxID=3365577 RepID=UPI003717B333
MGEERSGDAARAFELLEPLVLAATVRIHAAPDGYADPGSLDTWGSGFFIAPGWVLTCAHVVGEGGGAPVRLTGREIGITFSSGDDGATGTVAGRVECVLPEPDGRPRPAGLWPLPDIALVRVLAPVSHACVWLSDRPRPRFEEVAYFGCTDEMGYPEITGRTTTLRGVLGRQSALRLGAEDEVEAGMSGGPVVDLVRGEVVGVVKARRQGGGGGLAVAITQLRELPQAPRGRAGLYRRVMQGHDLHHYDQHLSDLNTRRTWTDVHEELPEGREPFGGRQRLTAAERTTLCGLLAELPPPGSSEAVQQLAEEARGEDRDPGLKAPLTWRDGLGLLYDPPGVVSEAAAMLRYATDVSTADHREPPSPGADDELWDWVRGTAERLWRPLRRELGERHEQGLADREQRRRAAAARSVRGPAGREAGLLPPGPSVLLEIWAHTWDPLHDWRVSVWLGPEHLAAVDSGVDVRPDRLPAALRAPLAEGFRRCDTHEGAALLEVAVEPELFGLPVDAWTVTGGVPLGVQRPVVFRYPAGALQPTGEQRRRHADRWSRTTAGPLQDERADCAGGRPRMLPYEALAALPDQVVPVHCRLGAVHEVRDAGFAVSVARRPPPGPPAGCAPFHRGVREELAEAGGAGPLPLRLQSLRGRAYGRDPDAYWAAGTALVWEDPDRPLPCEEPLQGDL